MSEMYFEAQPTSAFVPMEYEVDYMGKRLSFHSASGVFSKGGLDRGTKVLLDAIVDRFGEIGRGKSGALLDLGCGIGTLGIVLKRLYPDLTLTLADCNERALALAKQNVEVNRLGKNEVLRSDAWSELGGRVFDYVVTNPPIRAGKAVVQAFFTGAQVQLREGGELICVLSKQQGADSAKRFLKTLFGNCETIWRDKGFHVLVCRKRSKSVETE